MVVRLHFDLSQVSLFDPVFDDEIELLMQFRIALIAFLLLQIMRARRALIVRDFSLWVSPN